MEKYNAPRRKPIEVLDLIMRREFAEEILSGEKKVEIRQCSDHYFNRLTDKTVDAWMTEYQDAEGMDMEAFTDFIGNREWERGSFGATTILLFCNWGYHWNRKGQNGCGRNDSYRNQTEEAHRLKRAQTSGY